MIMETLFVYGTLRKGGSNHFRLNGARSLGMAKVRGRLYRVDWYPALLLDPDAGEVIGELFEVSPETLAALDQFEGAEYRRIRVTTRIDHAGEVTEAWIWEYLDAVDESRRIQNGDWLSAIDGD